MRNEFAEKRLKSNLRGCQLMQVELLKEFDRICRKHDLAYWVDGGTLLGAVRHGGFIPWDDDVDVAMPSRDFLKFVAVAQAELPEGLFLQTSRTDRSYPQTFVKLLNLNSMFLSPGDDLGSPYQKCIYIDIFQFTEYPTLPRSLVRRVGPALSRACYWLAGKHHVSFGAVLTWFATKLKFIALKTLWRLCCLLPGGVYMSNIIEDNGYGIVHRNDSILPLRRIAFEDGEFSAPADPDAYLKDLYGNYMELPPVEKRVSHAVYIETKLY